MKIISPFKDYYDSAAGYGYDDSRLYKRETQIETVAPQKLPGGHSLVELFRNLPTAREFYWKMRPALLLIAEERYLLWLTVDRANRDEVKDPKYLLAQCATSAEWVHRVSETRHAKDPLRLAFFAEENSPEDQFDRHPADYLVPLYSMQRAQRSLRATVADRELHLQQQSPVLLILPTEHVTYWSREIKMHLVKDPVLKTFGIQRILDPFTLYQKLEIYLGSALAPPDLAPQRVGDDETLAKQKGFDEWSFRTAAPGHKKENRKVNRLRKRGGGEGANQ